MNTKRKCRWVGPNGVTCGIGQDEHEGPSAPAGHTFTAHRTQPTTPPATTGAPGEVYAVCSWDNCDCESGAYREGTPVVALFATEQTARQYLDVKGGHSFGHVTRMPVRTSLPSY